MIEELLFPDFKEYFQQSKNHNVPYWIAFWMLEKLHPEISEEELTRHCSQYQYSLTEINYEKSKN